MEVLAVAIIAMLTFNMAAVIMDEKYEQRK